MAHNYVNCQSRIYISTYLLAASSFFRSSNSSRDTSLGRELLLVHAGTVVEGSGFSPFVMDTDLRIPPDRSRAVPFDMLVSGIAGIVVESVLASDMTTSFADPVEEAEPVEDTDSIDDFRLAQSSLLLDIATSDVRRYPKTIE